MEAVNVKRYFIMRGGRQAGPYTLEQLRDMAITPGTSGWNEKAVDRMKADTFQDLNAILDHSPPVVHRGPLHWLRIGRKHQP